MLNRDAADLLLMILEGRDPVISGEVLEDCFAQAGSAIREAGLLIPDGHELVTTAREDHYDAPVTLVRADDDSGFGYFSGTAGWVAQPMPSPPSLRWAAALCRPERDASNLDRLRAARGRHRAQPRRAPRRLAADREASNGSGCSDYARSSPFGRVLPKPRSSLIFADSTLLGSECRAGMPWMLRLCPHYNENLCAFPQGFAGYCSEGSIRG